MNEAPDGMYLVKDGVTYQVTPRIKIPLAKKVNLMTGEVTYPTNADHIRSMSDEELARFINFHTDCENCPASRVCEDNYTLSSDVCMADIRKWLKEEAKE